MALTVGELIAYIRADGSQFNSELDRSKSKFSAVGSIIKTGTLELAKSFTAVTAATVGLGTAAFVVGANYNVLQQSSRAALATLLGGAEAANVQMDKLDAFARSSPFAKQVFITAQQQLLGFGVEAERVIPILDAVQNAVAAVGGGNEQVSQVTYALAQMQGQGKLTGETLNQLGQYGIDAAGILGEALGKTGAEIRELASKPGGIPVDQVWDPLVAGLMDRFGGATDAIKEQFSGAVDRIKGAWRDIGSVLATPFIDPHGGGMAVEWSNKVADALRALEQKAKPLVDLIIQRFRPGLDAVSPALDKVRSAINNIDLSKFNHGLDQLVAYKPLIAGVSGALLALGGPALLGPLGGFLPAINPVVAGLAALIATTPGMREVGSTLLDSLRPVLPLAQEFGTTVADTVLAVLAELVPALSDAAVAAGPLAMALAEGLGPAATTAVEALVPVASTVADVISWISELPTPILLGVAAFVILKATLGGPLLAAWTVGRTAVVNYQASLAAAQTTASTTGTTLSTMGAMASVARTGVFNLGNALKAAFISNPIGLAIMAISTAITIFSQKAADAKARADAYSDAVSLMGDEMEEAAKRVAATAFNTGEGLDWGWYQSMRTGHSDFMDVAKELELTLDDLVSATMMSDDAFAEWEASLRAAGDANGWASEKVEEAVIKVAQQRGAIDDATEAQRKKTEAEAIGKSATDESTDAVTKNTEALSLNTSAAMENSGQVLSAKEASLRYQETVAGTSAKIAENNTVIAENTAALNSGKLSAEEAAVATAAIEAAQRSNEEATLSLTRAGLAQIDANAKNGASGDELRGQMQGLRDEVINSRIAMGESQEQANTYADSLGLIPTNIKTQVELDNAEAARKADEMLKAFNKLRQPIRPTVSIAGKDVFDFAANGAGKENGGIVQAFAAGGIAGDGSVVDRVSQIAAGGRNIVWAEPSTGWEAYISGKPDQRNRNLRVLDETARRLGRITLPAGTTGHANGATLGARPTVMPPAGGGSSSPQMPSTLVVVDVDGALIGRMRVESGRVMTGRITPLSEGRATW